MQIVLEENVQGFFRGFEGGGRGGHFATPQIHFAPPP